MRTSFNHLTGEIKPWFKEWFNTSYYHKLYSNRSDKEAADFIDALIAVLKPAEQANMLDVGCGNGRHCRQLGKNFIVTGIDIAPASIIDAKRKAGANMQFYEHDMRLPFGKEDYDFVFNLFTSFGYFKNLAEHGQVLDNMASALKPGGKLILDYLNIFPAEKNLVPVEEKVIDGILFKVKRWMDEDYFYKEITIYDLLLPKPIVFTEQVARFDLHDFKDMFAACGLQLLKLYGNYQLDAFDRESSSRLILIAGKCGE